MHHPRPARTSPSRRWGPPLATVTTAALLGTFLVAVPASATATASTATEGLPGTGSLTELATARPATLEQAEQQFLGRTPEQFRDQDLVWAPCTAEEVGQAEAAALLECTRVLVPRDWNAPTEGDPLSIAISRLPQAGERPARTVVTNPGGPGGAGLALASLGNLPALAATEVIGLDVRGTGASSPLTCGGDATAALLVAPDPRDRSPEALAAGAAAVQDAADACGADPLIDVVNTEQTMADIDLVRDALDRETIDWVGYSGGTWLGSQFATYFPARVGRFVLDSSVDATTSFQEVFTGYQPMAFQRRLEQDYAPYAAQYSWLYHLGNSPEEVVATYERIRASYAANPVPLPAPMPALDGKLIDGMVIQSMYSKSLFEQLSWILLGLQTVDAFRATGDTAAADRATADVAARLAAVPELTEEQVPAAESSYATFLATTCNDTTWSRGSEFWNGLGQDRGEEFPLAGWSKTQQPCGHWDRAELTLPAPDGRDLPPLLIVQSRHDPATAFEGAVQTHEALGSSILVTVEGEGDHGLYGMAGNPCVDEVVDTFLTTGEAPAQDVTCEGTGIPAPGSALVDALGLRELIG